MANLTDAKRVYSRYKMKTKKELLYNLLDENEKEIYLNINSDERYENYNSEKEEEEE